MPTHADFQRCKTGGQAAPAASLLFLLAAMAAYPAHAADMRVGAAHDRVALSRCYDGFVVPGSDTCMRIGGYARLDISTVGKDWLGTDGYNVDSIAVNGYSVAPDGFVPTIGYGFRGDTVEMYSEARIHLTTLTQTEYGAVRAYIEGEALDDDTRTGGALGLRHAFVQFGNWTFGKTWSTLLHQASGPRYSDPYVVVGDNSTAIRRSQIRYTQPFGNGVSLSLALEDQGYGSPSAAIVGVGPNAPVLDPGATALAVTTDSNAVPDLVAALNWTQKDVGSAQIAGALHQNRYVELQTFGGTPTPTANDSDTGFALLAGLALDLPTGEGDKVTFLANYTDGASQYLQDFYGSTTTVAWGRCGTASCILDQVRKWSAVSSMTHYWTPEISIAFGAGYSETNYGARGTAQAGLAAVPGVLNVASIEAFANLLWEPVPRMTFMVDVHYGHIDYRGFDLDPAIAGIQDAQGAWAATLEITRHY
jgi:hypothetical protein